MKTSSALIVCLHFLCGLVSPEEHDRERRDLSMLRMGKRGMEVLPARAIELPPLVPPNYEVGDEYEEREIIIPENGIPRQVWVPRVGKDMDDAEGRYARVPPFPRVGKTFVEYLNELRRDISDDDLRQFLTKYTHSNRQKRSLDETDAADNQEQKSEHKRAAAFPRVGLRDEEELHEEERAFPRIGLQERAMPFPRLGLQERAMPFPRLGLQERAFPRIGLQERSIPLSDMGFGEFDENAVKDSDEKRSMSMLRMGKRGMKMLRMGKRPVNMLRMGRSQDSAEEEKRAMSMLRMGKRPMSMLRMGRSSDAATEEEKRAIKMLRMGKRSMSMLRMGRSSDFSDIDEKRAMSMLRMGRSQPQEEEKRAMSMLRMGKRPVNMLRMGKRDAENVQSASADGMNELIAKEES